MEQINKKIAHNVQLYGYWLNVIIRSNMKRGNHHLWVMKRRMEYMSNEVNTSKMENTLEDEK